MDLEDHTPYVGTMNPSIVMDKNIGNHKYTDDLILQKYRIYRINFNINFDTKYRWARN